MEHNANKTIITVVGKDTVGIIAKVCTYLSENGVNVLDISQTIVSGYFNMMMIVDMTKAAKAFAAFVMSTIIIILKYPDTMVWEISKTFTPFSDR